jgi:hypothetical protein
VTRWIGLAFAAGFRRTGAGEYATALEAAFLAEAGALLERPGWRFDAERLLRWVADKQTHYAPTPPVGICRQKLDPLRSAGPGRRGSGGG